MAKLAPPNYLGTHAAPGALRPDPLKPIISNPPRTTSVTPTSAGRTQLWPQQKLTPADAQGWYTNLYRGDLMGQSQSSALASSLGRSWAGSVVAPFQQALIQYGAGLDPAILEKLKSFNAPEWLNPFTGQTAKVGLSLADALDPAKSGGIDVMAEAAKNPFSTTSQILRQHNLANYTGQAGVLGQGGIQSGGIGRMFYESQYEADRRRAEAAQAILSQISGAYQGFLGGTYDPAIQTQAGYTAGAEQRIADMIAQGQIQAPTTWGQLHPQDVAVRGVPGQRPVGRVGYGRYRYKPLY